MGKGLGDAADPLLVSVRSGAKFSMPGMMDTVLNIGLNDESVQGLAKQADNARFAWDSYRRLVQMFGKTVLGVDGDLFEHAMDEAKRAKGTTNDLDLDEDDIRGLVTTFKQIVRDHTGRDFPQDPREQMDLAVTRRLRLLERRPRQALPPPGAHPGRPRHRRQHRRDGVRQHRHDLGHRRRVHP